MDLTTKLREAAKVMVGLAALTIPGNIGEEQKHQDPPAAVRKCGHGGTLSEATTLTGVNIAPAVSHKLIMVGGGHIPDEALSRFMTWAGAENSHVLYIPWATEDPAGSFEYFKNRTADYQMASLECAPRREEMARHKAEFIQQLSSATAVFFSGGDQTEIMKVLTDGEVLAALRDKFDRGFVFAGTSAGTAIMSEIMITGDLDYSDPKHPHMGTSQGLGLFRGAVVDQHFLQRNRLGRLEDVLQTRHQAVGIGVDVSTALVVENNRDAEILGGKVVIVSRLADSPEFVIETFDSGSKLDLSYFIDRQPRPRPLD